MNSHGDTAIYSNNHRLEDAIHENFKKFAYIYTVKYFMYFMYGEFYEKRRINVLHVWLNTSKETEQGWGNQNGRIWLPNF